MAPYRVHGKALDKEEGELHRYLLGAALTGLAASSDASLCVKRPEVLAALSRISSDAIDLADLTIRELRARADERAEASSKEPPASVPTGFYWVGRTGEVGDWMETHRHRNPMHVQAICKLDERSREGNRPVSLETMMREWALGKEVLRTLINLRWMVEAGDDEVARSPISPDERRQALAARAVVMSAGEGEGAR